MSSADPSDAGAYPPQDQGVLRRMLQDRSRARLGQGGAPQLPPTPAPTPARAAATAIGRVAERLYGLAVQPVLVTPGAMTLAELPELLPDLPLVAVLQGPGDSLGAIALCPQAVAALIETQALGRVTGRVLERRRPTRSDALLCAEFIDALLAELPVEMEGVDGFDTIAGYHFLTHLDDPRPLALMLEDRPYRSLAFDLRIGEGDTREGRILLALPQPASVVRSPRTETPVAAVPVVPAAAVPRATLAPVMHDAPVDLLGILCRRPISLAELRSLTEGRVLTLPRACLAQATLETPDGQVVATGKFGEAEGCHAIRLRDPAVPLAQDDAPATARGDTGDILKTAHLPGDLGQPDPFRAESGTGNLQPRATGTELARARG